MLTRSLPSVERATVQPPSTGPTTSSSGTKTSSKNTSLNMAPPEASRRGRTSTPEPFISITIVVIPACLGASGSVRTVARPRWQNWAPLVQTFWPLTSQPPSTRVPGCGSGGVGPGVGLAEELAPHELALQGRADPACHLVRGRLLDQGEQHPAGDAVVGALEPGLAQFLVHDELLDGLGLPAPGPGPVGHGEAGLDQTGPLLVGR